MNILARWNERPLTRSSVVPVSGSRLFDQFFDDFFNEFDRQSLGKTQATAAAHSFGVDLNDGKDDVTVFADLPGFKKEDVTIEFEENHLVIRAERKFEAKDEDNKDGWRIERRFGRFERVIPISADVLTDKASASFTDGVLKVLLPKAPESLKQARQIKISNVH